MKKLIAALAITTLAANASHTYNLSATFSDEQVIKYAKYYGWADTVDGEPNPVTYSDFAKAHAYGYLKEIFSQPFKAELETATYNNLRDSKQAIEDGLDAQMSLTE